jgi:hypothetical protein
LVPFCVLVITIALFAVSYVVQDDEIHDCHPTHLPWMSGIFALQAILYAVITIVGRGAMIRAVAELQLILREKTTRSTPSLVKRKTAITCQGPSLSISNLPCVTK